MSEKEVTLNEQHQNAPQYDFDLREMMRYRVNKFSSTFGLLGMIFSLFGAFICLNSMNPNDPQVIFIILMNVVILLGGFLASEKIKAYNANGAIAQLVFGGICAARIFYIPLILMINYSTFVKAYTQNAYGKWVVDPNASQDVAKASSDAAKNLGATITSKFSGNVANAYLPSSGYFRGISAMVLLAIAACCFIVAGVVGLKKAKTLDSYMEEIKKD